MCTDPLAPGHRKRLLGSGEEGETLLKRPKKDVTVQGMRCHHVQISELEYVECSTCTCVETTSGVGLNLVSNNSHLSIMITIRPSIPL